jgi:hypothetical protein
LFGLDHLFINIGYVVSGSSTSPPETQVKLSDYSERHRNFTEPFIDNMINHDKPGGAKLVTATLP